MRSRVRKRAIIMLPMNFDQMPGDIAQQRRAHRLIIDPALAAPVTLVLHAPLLNTIRALPVSRASECKCNSCSIELLVVSFCGDYPFHVVLGKVLLTGVTC